MTCIRLAHSSCTSPRMRVVIAAWAAHGAVVRHRMVGVCWGGLFNSSAVESTAVWCYAWDNSSSAPHLATGGRAGKGPLAAAVLEHDAVQLLHRGSRVRACEGEQPNGGQRMQERRGRAVAWPSTRLTTLKSAAHP